MKFITKHPDSTLFGIFILCTVFIFRNAIFFHKVPFPGNLLVSFYQPWISYRQGGYTHGPAAKPIGFDTLRSFYPTRTLVTGSVKSGALPLWNPHSFSGNVLLGAYQSAVFFPLGFLFLLFSQIDAWSVIIILSPIFVSIFTYLFLRELKLTRKASFFGAITWAFSGIMIVWWEEMFMAVYSILTLPLVLLAIERLLKKTTVGPFILLVGGIAASVFSGWFQATFYLVTFSVVWVVFRLLCQKKKSFMRFVFIVFGFLTGALVSGIQLVPGLEAYVLSSRGTTDTKVMFEQFFAGLPQLVTFLAPDYFGNPATHNYFGTSFYHEQVIWIGIPALIFVLYEMLHVFRAPGVSRFFTTSAIVTLSLGFSLPTSWALLYSLRLPLVSEMTPSRIFFLSGFCLSVLAAMGLDRFMKKGSWRPMAFVFLVLAIAFAGAAWFAYRYEVAMTYLRDIHAWVPIRNLIIPSMVFLVTIVAIILIKLKRKLATPGYVLLLVIAFGGTVYFAQKYLYFSDRAFTYPDVPVITELRKISGINRFWSIGEGTIVRNFANVLGLSSPEGYESFNSKRYGELIFSSHRQGQFPSEVQRADALLYPPKNINELSGNPYTLRLLSLLGVRYIAALPDTAIDKNTLDSAGFSLAWTDGTYEIYRYDKALPRFFLAHRYIVETDGQKILDSIYDPKISLSETLVLEEELKNALISAQTPGTVSLVQYAPEKIIFKTSAPGDELLFLSDTYYPGWNATVDGRATPIYRADFAFRAVPVPKGDHVVTMEYQPTSLKIGALLSALGIVMVGAAVFWVQKSSASR